LRPAKKAIFIPVIGLIQANAKAGFTIQPESADPIMRSISGTSKGLLSDFHRHFRALFCNCLSQALYTPIPASKGESLGLPLLQPARIPFGSRLAHRRRTLTKQTMV
jgi:hypothetical protein